MVLQVQLEQNNNTKFPTVGQCFLNFNQGPEQCGLLGSLYTPPQAD